MSEEASESPPGPARTSLQWKILAGLVAGGVLGLILNSLAGSRGEFREQLDRAVREVIHPAGKLFLRLLFMAVVPLVFASLALGVARLGSLRRLGGMGLKTLAATVVLSSISVVLGFALVDLIEPGRGIAPEVRERVLRESAGPEGGDVPWLEKASRVVPDSVRAAGEVFEGHVLAVMFAAVVFGAGLAAVRTEGTAALVRMTEGLHEISFWIIAQVFRLAPFGVAALGFALMARLGIGAFLALGKYVLVVLAGLLIHEFLVYSLLLRFACAVSPREFFRRISPAMLTAFATSSSSATLPTTLQVSRGRLGIPAEIGNFVLTLGSTFNQNGTALFEGVTVLFLAQLYGIDLGAKEQLMVLFLSVAAGIGTAGVPGGSIPMIAAVLVAVGVPSEGIGIILGVDRFLDMCRTVLNVTGDLVAAAFIARTEGALRLEPEEGRRSPG